MSKTKNKVAKKVIKKDGRVSNGGKDGNGGLIVFTDKQLEELADISQYLKLVQIADYFGIHRNTFIELRKRDERIDMLYKRGKAMLTVDLARTLHGKSKGTIAKDVGCTTSNIFMLKCRGEYVEEQRDTVIVTSDIDNASESREEREARMEDIKLFTKWKNERERSLKSKKYGNMGLAVPDGYCE